MTQMTTGDIHCPGQIVNTVLHGERHQRVVAGMKAHLVQPAAVAIERYELGLVAVGRCTQLQHLF